MRDDICFYQFFCGDFMKNTKMLCAVQETIDFWKKWGYDFHNVT